MISAEFKKLNQAIENAGLIIMRYFGEQLALEHKSTSADYRTKADVESEQVIIEAIEEIFPDYNIFGEEHGEKNKGSEFTFVIDPLDGTNNFVLGIPAFTSSVALMKDKEVIYGVIHCPIIKDTYYALKGQGAFLNNQPISVNNENSAKNATISYYCNYVFSKDRVAEFKSRLAALNLRRCLELWAPAFCYCSLASGRIEGIVNDGIELHDFAAGKLIAREAGAKITSFAGEEINDDTADVFVATNGTDIHSLLIDRVTNFTS